MKFKTNWGDVYYVDDYWNGSVYDVIGLQTAREADVVARLIAEDLAASGDIPESYADGEPLKIEDYGEWVQ
jgi:hypothetical protein